MEFPEDDEFEEDEFPDDDAEAGAGMPSGLVMRFYRTLTPEQLPMWQAIQKGHRSELRTAKRVSGRSNRDSLYDAMNTAQGKITADKIERLINKAVEKGDPNALRIMAQMAGMDLADRPKQAAGEGAKVIIIRPHPMLLTPAEEASVQSQIEERL